MTFEDILNLPESIKNTVSLAGRQNQNPNHNLWNNHGTICVHFTVHHQNNKVERIRLSLKTSSFELARHRRDQIFAALNGDWNAPAVNQQVFVETPGTASTNKNWDSRREGLYDTGSPASKN